MAGHDCDTGNQHSSSLLSRGARSSENEGKPLGCGDVFGDQMADARRRPRKVDRVHKGLSVSAAASHNPKEHLC